MIRRSIFAKIFFWFWAALILVAASVIFITVLSGTQSLGQRWLSHSLDLYGATAVDLYTRGGKPALEKYLDSIDRSARAPRRKTPAAVFRTRARLRPPVKTARCKAAARSRKMPTAT